MIRDVKLRPEPVPRPLWGLSAYRLLGRGSKWKKIRMDAVAAAGNRCSVCRVELQTFTCHEQWQYDDKAETATVVAFVVHCSDCDTATHVGRSLRHGLESVVLKQLCRVNHCTRKQAEGMIAEALTEWRIRNSRRWTVLVSAELLASHPTLTVLHQKQGVEERRRPSTV
jgi:hypothetical protein